MTVNNLEIRALSTVEEIKDSTVEGYAIKFNSESRDLGGFIEIIEPTAFDGVDMSDVRAFMDHDAGKLLGRTASGTLELTIDERGVKFKLDLPNTTVGRDALELVKRGDLNQCSFGFTVAEDEWYKQGDKIYRSIKKIGNFFEISLVSIPAYDDTDVSVAKRGLNQAVNDLEKEKLSLELDLLGLA